MYQDEVAEDKVRSTKLILQDLSKVRGLRDKPPRECHQGTVGLECVGVLLRDRNRTLIVS